MQIGSMIISTKRAIRNMYGEDFLSMKGSSFNLSNHNNERTDRQNVPFQKPDEDRISKKIKK